MALPPEQTDECVRAIGEFIAKRRPPAELRAQVDIRAVVDGSTVTLMFLRPHYLEKSEILEHPFARARWVGTKKVWQLYWMRANGEWNSYQAMPSAKTMREILAEVDRDPNCCFFG